MPMKWLIHLAVLHSALTVYYLHSLIRDGPSVSLRKNRKLQKPITETSKPRFVLLEAERSQATPNRQLHHSILTKRRLPDDEASEFYLPANLRWNRNNCQPIYQSKLTSSCNLLHEVSMDNPIAIGSGSYRVAFRVGGQVLRTIRRDPNFELRQISPKTWRDQQQMDVSAMEYLSPSSRVVDLYASCGTSMLTEMGETTLGSLIRTKQINNTLQMLEIAYQVALALQDVHDVHRSGQPILAHGDFHVRNILRTQDNRFIVNDMNQAIWIAPGCKYSNDNFHGLALPERPPERLDKDEFFDPVAADMFGLGNILAALLYQNPRPFISIVNQEQAAQRRMITVNETAWNDPAIRTLVFSAATCLSAKPEDRPTAAEVTRSLETALRWIREETELAPRQLLELFGDPRHFAYIQVVPVE